MRSFGNALLAEMTAFEVYLYRASELKLHLLIFTPVGNKRALHDNLLTFRPETGGSQESGSSALPPQPATPHGGCDAELEPALIAPSNHKVRIEQYHACSWRYVPPHLRDEVHAIRAFIELARTRVGNAILLAYQIPDLMDPETLEKSEEFLILSHIVAPPTKPAVPPELGSKSIVEAANALFAKRAYQTIQRAEYGLYFPCTGSMLERVLAIMGKSTYSKPSEMRSSTARTKVRMGSLISI